MKRSHWGSMRSEEYHGTDWLTDLLFIIPIRLYSGLGETGVMVLYHLANDMHFNWT